MNDQSGAGSLAMTSSEDGTWVCPGDLRSGSGELSSKDARIRWCGGWYLLFEVPIEMWCREDEAAAILQTKNFVQITVDELMH
jgi:hypothetical protein